MLNKQYTVLIERELAEGPNTQRSVKVHKEHTTRSMALMEALRLIGEPLVDDAEYHESNHIENEKGQDVGTAFYVLDGRSTPPSYFITVLE